jgi:hypothetical protein
MSRWARAASISACVTGGCMITGPFAAPAFCTEGGDGANIAQTAQITIVIESTQRIAPSLSAPIRVVAEVPPVAT